MASSIRTREREQRPLLSYPPFSVIYQLLSLGLILVRIPPWILSFALDPSRKPHPQWTLEQALAGHLVKSLLRMLSKVEQPQKLTLKPKKEKGRFDVIEPFPPTFYKGPLEAETVAPATIGGTWFPQRPQCLHKADEDTSVVLHFHGGAFIVGDGRSSGMDFLTSTWIEYAGVSTIFCPQYRLSCRPDPAPFPASLQDALSSYLYLTQTLDIPPSSITVSGDSAGGNLAIALLRYLAEFGEELDIPLPKNAVLISPWVSPLNSLKPDSQIKNNPHFRSDSLPTLFTRWGAKAYTRLVPATHPYISPLGHPFATRVPIFVNYGSAEVLEVDGSQWIKEMSQVAGNVIQANYEPAAPHDTLLVGNMCGWKKSAQGVAVHVGEFIREYHTDPDKGEFED
ncbi:alpha/beta hydrolase fold-3 domain-containing protein [Whalleya microplaca]|nr:alpha/beta hydrolase fold-3 domain-containing protein [Whalleya microplaca]